MNDKFHLLFFHWLTLFRNRISVILPLPVTISCMSSGWNVFPSVCTARTLLLYAQSLLNIGFCQNQNITTYDPEKPEEVYILSYTHTHIVSYSLYNIITYREEVRMHIRNKTHYIYTILHRIIIYRHAQNDIKIKRGYIVKPRFIYHDLPILYHTSSSLNW